MKIRNVKQYHTMARYVIAYLIMEIRCISALLAMAEYSNADDMKSRKMHCEKIIKGAFYNRHSETMMEFYNDVLRKKGL